MMQSDPIILAFDTTGLHDSLSLYHKGILTSKVLPQGGSQLQSSFLVPSLIHLLAQQNLTLKDVQVLTTVAGPGSFTGIRIGLATLQGLLLAHSYQPIVPNLLQVLAFAAARHQPGQRILSLIDTKRGDYFAQHIQPDLTAHQEAFILDPKDLTSFIHNADIVVSNASLPSFPEVWVPRELISELLVQFCLTRKKDKELKQYERIEPFYLRNPEFKKQPRFCGDSFPQ